MRPYAGCDAWFVIRPSALRPSVATQPMHPARHQIVSGCSARAYPPARGHGQVYVADHWCQKGHVLLVLEGELETVLADGRVFKLKGGMSYQVADDAEPHMSRTTTGARLFIVD